MEYFAVIDTETNWDNEVMSIGVAIAEKETFLPVVAYYFIFDPEFRVGGMYSSALPVKGHSLRESITSRAQAMECIIEALEENEVTQIFAYNASFDKGLLPELSCYEWYDIMRIAAYRQYNKSIPLCADCCRTGKMKRAYGVEPMLRLLSANRSYQETHNAYFDALDELEIMRLLAQPLDVYGIARLP